MFAASATAQAEPPVTPETQVTAPLPEGGRRGPPPPRPSNKFEPSHATATANELGLTRRDDGRYEYVDPARRFTLVIAEDGTPYFADRWRKAARKNKRRGKAGGRPAEPLFKALNPFVGVPMRGPVEWILEARGHDIYTSGKATALQSTEEFRAQLAIAWQRKAIRYRLTTLPSELEKLWADPKISLLRKRAILFERWDECAAEYGPDGEAPDDAVARIADARRTAATQARKIIVRFIRTRAPQGSTHGYTTAELRKFNVARRSTAKFRPYEK